MNEACEFETYGVVTITMQCKDEFIVRGGIPAVYWRQRNVMERDHAPKEKKP